MTMQIGNPSASFTRPANTTAYASGQLVSNSTTAASCVPMSFVLDNGFPVAQFRITRARIIKSGTGVANATFRLHLYQVAPVVQTGSGDGATWLTDNSANWLGNIDISSMLPFSDGATGTGSCPAGSEMFIRAPSTQPAGGPPAVFGLLAALGAYTPASGEKFTVIIEPLETF